jgi:hypothetical protein
MTPKNGKKAVLGSRKYFFRNPLDRNGWDLAEWLERLECQFQSHNSTGFDPSILRQSGI